MSTASTGAVEIRPEAEAAGAEVVGGFVTEDGETWYRIGGYDGQAPFFMALAGDSDLWAFVSSAGSLAAGRRDEEGAFLPYETVDKIHQRWEHTGPRTWIRADFGQGIELWQPFASTAASNCAPAGASDGVPHSGAGPAPRRSVWKTLSGSRIRFRETHPSGRLVFQYEWFTAAGLGLVRSARLMLPQAACAPGAPAHASAPLSVQVLDGVLNLLPPHVGTRLSATLSSLTDAYKWNEAAAGGRLGIYTLYAQVWDRPEPKESFHALVAWHAGLPADTCTLLSAQQVRDFCRTGQVSAEPLTRGRRGAYLVRFDADIGTAGLDWHLVVDAPCSQVQTAELAQRLAAGDGTPEQILQGRARNEAGLAELLARADGLQRSGDPMAAAHHQANVLFNIMRGGVFVDGTRLNRDDLLAYARQRHRALGQALTAAAAAAPVHWPEHIERAQALALAQQSLGAQGLRLVMEYLPLTFSRRHGDPSRPWNRFSIQVRDAAGQRVVNHQGNWRDIFQNWEALAASEPAYLDSMVTVFLGAMTPDGYNPYRIGREGIDWEVTEPEDPWSFIGYWGDHQVVYLLKLLEASEAHQPGRLAALWDQALFSFADVPYRLKPHAEQTVTPKATIRFDQAAHEQAHARAQALGSDGLRVCDAEGLPVLATLGEKLATIVLAKAGSLVPGGGLWLHTQRPEWNDANNALVGNGLSVVTLAHLRRFLAFVAALPGAQAPFALSAATLQALVGLQALVRATPTTVLADAAGRRQFLDGAGQVLDAWRSQAYRGAPGRQPAQAPAGLLTSLARDLLPLVDATLQANRRDDGLFHAYNLVDLAMPGRAALSHLYPMLEGQVALLSSGLLQPPQAVALLDALFASPLYCPRRHSFMLYPDRALPGFLARNRLDDAALALPVVQRLLAEGRSELLQRQSDGTVRFAPGLSNRADLEAAGAGLGQDLIPLAQAYERLLGHHAFTGRSGTMFGYEGLGCIYWHMVAKLLLAVQEQVFAAHDAGAPELPALCAHYRRVRDGLGYRKTAAEYGAFPADPYSHTPAEGGAQQPGMTGQVKEEILTRWGELGLRVQAGRIGFCPVLTDAAEVPPGGALEFTFRRVPWRIQRGDRVALRVQRAGQWQDVPSLAIDPQGVSAVEAWVVLDRG